MKHRSSAFQLELSGSLVALALMAPLGLMLLPGSEAKGSSPSSDDQFSMAGPDACKACHSNEHIGWGQSRHSETFDILGEDEAYDIADAIDIDLDEEEEAMYCVRCHASTIDGADEPIGVSCESCHGPSSEWLKLHNEAKRGADGKIVKENGNTVYLDRDLRIRNASEQGMIDTGNLYALVHNCLACHTVPDERLVNEGGHNAGTSAFELLSFSQGEVRHHFLHGANNDDATPERKSLLFVVGKLADLEVSLKNLSKAGEGDYAEAMIERVRKVLPELKTITAKSGFEKEAFAALIAGVEALELAPGAGADVSEAAGALAMKVAVDCKGIAGLDLPKGQHGDVYTK